MSFDGDIWREAKDGQQTMWLPSCSAVIVSTGPTDNDYHIWSSNRCLLINKAPNFRVLVGHDQIPRNITSNDAIFAELHEIQRINTRREFPIRYYLTLSQS